MTENTNSDTHEEFATRLAKLFFFTLAVAFGIGLFYYANFDGGVSTKHTKWGEFGDFIGGTIGTIVSFIALFALLLTISLQSKALRISQQELKLTREEAAKASTAAQAQVVHFDGQAKIDDIVSSIKELEEELSFHCNKAVWAFNHRDNSVVEIKLGPFIKKEFGTVIWFSEANPGFDPGEKIDDRRIELGQFFKLLFEQIIALSEIGAAHNRYRIFMQKHLEMFFYIDQIGLLQFDLRSKLDTESLSILNLYQAALTRGKLRRNI